MASENTFSPHSRAQDEREIARKQDDFSAGMFKDLPASEIPDNAVAELKNFVNKGSRLVTRPGTKKWGDYSTFTDHAPLPSIVTGLTATSTAIGNVRTIDNIVGYAFATTNVGDYFVHDDGTHEIITAVTDSDTIITTTESTAAKDSSAAWVRQQVNCLFFHPFKKKIILFIGTKLYVSNDPTMTSWIQAVDVGTSTDNPTNHYSTIKADSNTIYLFNPNGIYTLNLDSIPYLLNKINGEVPASRIPTTGSPITNIYERKVLYTLSQLSGVDPDENRLTAGETATLRWESATNAVEIASNGKSRDYGSLYTSGADYYSGTGVEVGIILNQKNSALQYQQTATHYSIYATLDAGVVGVSDGIDGKGNNPELFLWLEDVPIAKSFVGSLAADGKTFTAVSGTFDDRDVGAALTIWDRGASGFNTIAIDSKTSSKIVVLSEAKHTASGITIPTAMGGYTVLGSDTPVKTTSITQNASGTITSTLASGDFAFVSGDIGKKLFLPDGAYRHVSGYVNETTVAVAENTSGFAITSTSAVAYDAPGRIYTEKTLDDDLSNRQAGWPLLTRFHEPLPNGDLGEITPGFLFTSDLDSNYLYYSNLPQGYEYNAGYYHPTYQYAFFKDAIRQLKELPDRLVTYCSNSTHVIPINTFNEQNLPDLGITVPIIAGQHVIDAAIGVVDYGSISDLDMGRHIMITNEPAIRIFDGNNYSENIATDRLVDEIKQFQNASSAIYSPLLGYIFWGNTE